MPFHSVTVQRTERLTIVVEDDTLNGAKARVQEFIDKHSGHRPFAYLLMEDWANETVHQDVKIDTDPLVILE